jgi:hypothetical protein
MERVIEGRFQEISSTSPCSDNKSLFLTDSKS